MAVFLTGPGRPLGQLERVVEGAHSQFHVFLLDQAGDLDLRGRNHKNIDVFVFEYGKHLRSHPGVTAHTDADDRHLTGIAVILDFFGIEHVLERSQDGKCLVQVGPGNGEGHVGTTFAAGILNNHVHGNTGFGDGGKQGGGHAGPVQDVADRDPALVLVVGDPRNQDVFHFRILLGDQRSRVVGEGAPDPDRYVVFLGEFDGADLQDFGPLTGELQHLVVGDTLHLAGGAAQIGVRGVDAVDIGVNLAEIGAKGRRQSHARGVGTAPAQGGQPAVAVHPLESGHDKHVIVVEHGFDGRGIDVLDAGLGEPRVGTDGDLEPE